MAGSLSIAQRGKEIAADTPRAEKVVKVVVDGRGWNIFKLIDFEMEVYSESKIAKGRFVVNEYNCQPFGVLHAGTTAYVAEAVASMLTAWASNFQRVAGVELNVNHLRPAPLGSEILLTSKPLLLGQRLQVWEVRFETEKPKPPGSDSKTQELVLVAVSRVSIMIIPTEDEFAPVRDEHDKFAGMTFIEQ
ncbi:unnamed protein product [Calypogeia fissa]